MSSNQCEINYQFLTSSKNFLYDAREDGKTHTPFHYELLLFRAKSATTSSTGGLVLALKRAFLLLAQKGGIASTFTGPL